MEHEVIIALVTLALGWWHGRKHGAKAEKAEEIIKEGAQAVLDDDGNPITDPTKAIVQVLIKHKWGDISRMSDELVAAQADAKRDEEAALARGREMAKGMDITIVDPHDGSETHKEP